MTTPPLTIQPLSTLTPTSPSRSWQSSPHPYLPLLATASSDRVVRIYSLTTFSLQSQITGGHKRSVRAVAWKPGLRSDRESVLATGSFDATAGIWRGENAKRRVGGGFLRGANTGEDAMEGVEGNDGDDEEPLDSGDEDDYAYSVQLSGHDSEIKSLTWSPHGTFLATCSRDKSVWVWESLPDEEDNLETVAVLQEHSGDVKSVAWHPADEACLASGSYDEQVRVWREDVDGEWTCVAVMEGHEGTVWCVAWEPTSHMERMERFSNGHADQTESDERLPNGLKPAEAGDKPKSGPRLASCSDDFTARLWRRKPKAPRPQQEGNRLPSIIRSTSDEEDWFEEQQLPKAHERAIYSLGWSDVTGRIVSCGSDGKIVVYEERRRTSSVREDIRMQDGIGENAQEPQINGDSQKSVDVSGGCDTEWTIVAELEAAHGVFEINHVCWARRYDSARRQSDEEVIVSTGDDGEVRVWTLEDATNT